jgi:hypothetical protein
MNTDWMFYQYKIDPNKKVMHSYLIVSAVYNDIIHNSLNFNYRKNTFDHFASIFG